MRRAEVSACRRRDIKASLLMRCHPLVHRQYPGSDLRRTASSTVRLGAGPLLFETWLPLVLLLRKEVFKKNKTKQKTIRAALLVTWHQLQPRIRHLAQDTVSQYLDRCTGRKLKLTVHVITQCIGHN